MKRDGSDDDSRLVSQDASQSTRGAVVQNLLPAVLDDELREDDGQGQLGSLGAQRVDVARQQCDERPVAARAKIGIQTYWREAGGGTRCWCTRCP